MQFRFRFFFKFQKGLFSAKIFLSCLQITKNASNRYFDGSNYNIVVLGGTSIDKQLFSHLDADKTMIEGDMKPDPVISERQRRAVSSLARHKWPSNSIPYVFDENPVQSISKSRIIT